MKNFQYSIRTSLGFIIALMGLLGVALAIMTGEIYRHSALDNHRSALVDLVQLKVNDLLHDLDNKSRALGLAVQHTNSFRTAFASKSRKDITHLLNNQFHQYFVTADVIKLKKLYAFDEYFNLLAESSEGSSNILPQEVVCSNLVKRAKRRHGAQRLQPISELCVHNRLAYQSVIVPIGGLKVIGYVGIITDPSHSLIATEADLGMPLRISLPNDKVVYLSEQWPNPNTMDDLILAEYTLQSQTFEPALKIAIVNNIQSLNKKLEKTRYLVMFVAGLATILTVIIVLYLFQKTMLKPLNQLTRQLRILKKDRSRLGELVSVVGNSEIKELATDFNEMTMELKNLHDSLENLTFTDALTDLPNKGLFQDRLEQISLFCQHNTNRFAVYMMDLDRFNEINETFGHHVGDELLKQVGSRIDNVLRFSDTVARLMDQTIARLGGDEFAAILPTVHDEKGAIVVAHKIQSAIEPPFTIEGNTLSIGISIGIAMYPQHGKDPQVLLHRAGIAMYKAKHNRLGFAFYDQLHDKHNLSQLTLISDLRKAIDHGELALHYQPKFDMQNQCICGLEALVRWQHPERGFMPPDNFIPLAEQTGLIKPLTLWVLNQAVNDCKVWHKEDRKLNIAVNLSMRNLSDLTVVDRVNEVLDINGLKPHWLCLEFNENAVMADSRRALTILNALHKNGVQLSIDNFGTGYSSLAYLKQLPVSEIKVDRSFVMDMKEDNNDAIIVRSTIDLAHNLGLKIVAVGVENAETWDRLKEQGCDMAQGNYMCRALSKEDFDDWLKTSSRGVKTTDKAETTHT